MKYYIFTDIHGHYNEYIELCKKLKIDMLDTNNNIIFMGDYIDRGYDNALLVESIIAQQKQYGVHRVIALLGNHEDMVIRALVDRDLYYEHMWCHNGGIVTKQDYDSIVHGDKILEKHLDWFQTLPYYYEIDNYVFCHSGSPNYKNKDLALWDRDWIHATHSQPLYGGKTMFFGHTPTNYINQTYKAYISPYKAIGIDCGICSCKGKLCCAILDTQHNTIEYQYQERID